MLETAIRAWRANRRSGDSRAASIRHPAGERAGKRRLVLTASHAGRPSLVRGVTRRVGSDLPSLWRRLPPSQPASRVGRRGSGAVVTRNTPCPRAFLPSSAQRNGDRETRRCWRSSSRHDAGRARERSSNGVATIWLGRRALKRLQGQGPRSFQIGCGAIGIWRPPMGRCRSVGPVTLGDCGDPSGPSTRLLAPKGD